MNPKSLENEEAYQKQFKKNIERLLGDPESMSLADMTASRDLKFAIRPNISTIP